MAEVDARAPPGQPRHLAQAADPAEARDLPQIPCHGHLDLLAWISSRRVPAPWRASLPGRRERRVSLWERRFRLVPACGRTAAAARVPCGRPSTSSDRAPDAFRPSGRASTAPDKPGNWDDRGMTRTDGYLLDNRQTEAGERFDAFAALFDPTTFRHLERLGIGSGWRCWEVGAGGTVRGVLAGQEGRPDRTGRRDRHRHLLGRPGRPPAGRGTRPRRRRGRTAGGGLRPGARPARPRPCAGPGTGVALDGRGAAPRRTAPDRGRRPRPAAAALPRRARPRTAARQPAAPRLPHSCSPTAAPTSPTAASFRGCCARPACAEVEADAYFPITSPACAALEAATSARSATSSSPRASPRTRRSTGTSPTSPPAHGPGHRPDDLGLGPQGVGGRGSGVPRREPRRWAGRAAWSDVAPRMGVAVSGPSAVRSVAAGSGAARHSGRRPSAHPLHRQRPRPAPLRRRVLGSGAREQGREERAGEGVARPRRVPRRRRHGGNLGAHGARPGDQRTVRSLFGDHQRDVAAQLGRRVRRIGQPGQQTRLVTARQQDVHALHQRQETVDAQLHEEARRRRIQTHRHSTRACRRQSHRHQRPARLGEQQIARQVQPCDAVEQRVRPVAGVQPQRRAAVGEERPLGGRTRVHQADHRPGRRLADRRRAVGRTPHAASSRSCHAAASAPTRPSSRTSAPPQRAAQQATLAPAPPGTVRIAAAVSVPEASGPRCRATTSVTTSPTTSSAPPPPGCGCARRPSGCHAPAQAAAIRPASRTLPRTAARLALSEAPSVCRTR